MAAYTLAILSCGLFIISTIEETNSRIRLESYLGDVDTSDGISEHEADNIARAYFSGFVSGCGGPDRAVRVGNEWVFRMSEGMGATALDNPLRIDSKSGGVAYQDGPSFIGYRSFRFYLLWGRPIHKIQHKVSYWWRDAMYALGWTEGYTYE